MLLERRKVEKEFRAFKVEWESNFVFVNHLGRPICLIFTEAIVLDKECFLISSRVCFYVFGVRDFNKLSDQHLIKVMTVTVNECSCAFSFLHE